MHPEIRARAANGQFVQRRAQALPQAGEAVGKQLAQPQRAQVLGGRAARQDRAEVADFALLAHVAFLPCKPQPGVARPHDRDRCCRHGDEHGQPGLHEGEHQRHRDQGYERGAKPGQVLHKPNGTLARFGTGLVQQVVERRPVELLEVEPRGVFLQALGAAIAEFARVALGRHRSEAAHDVAEHSDPSRPGGRAPERRVGGIVGGTGSGTRAQAHGDRIDEPLHRIQTEQRDQSLQQDEAEVPGQRAAAGQQAQLQRSAQRYAGGWRVHGRFGAVTGNVSPVFPSLMF